MTENAAQALYGAGYAKFEADLLLGLKDAAQVAETRSKTVEEISGKPAKEKAAVGESNA